MQQVAQLRPSTAIAEPNRLSYFRSKTLPVGCGVALLKISEKNRAATAAQTLSGEPLQGGGGKPEAIHAGEFGENFEGFIL